MIYSVIQFAYIIATALFIFSLHWMKDPKTARHGVFAGIAAMTVAMSLYWNRVLTEMDQRKFLDLLLESLYQKFANSRTNERLILYLADWLGLSDSKILLSW
jgi:NAD/NADP transhydrogenase beta subunit